MHCNELKWWGNERTNFNEVYGYSYNITPQLHVQGKCNQHCKKESIILL